MTGVDGKKREKDVLVKEFKPLTWWEKLYIPAAVSGLILTLRHLFFTKKVTVQYPEETLPIHDNFRAHQRLTVHEDGHVKCVACFMCSTACPAECIHIVAQEDPDPEVEKAPLSFEIDMLRCIYCGYCEEACPKDAIVMGPHYEFAATDRKYFDVGKEELVHKYDSDPGRKRKKK